MAPLAHNSSRKMRVFVFQLDNEQNYEEAYVQYKKALDYFMTGLKHEKNPSVKDTILKRAMGYMDRAEQLKKVSILGFMIPTQRA